MANIVMGLTRLGLRLYGKVQTGTELEITGVRVGDGYLADGDTIEELAALKSPVDTEVTVTDYSIIGDGQTALNLSIDSAEEDYYLREIGVFASDPDAGEILYAYCNFGENADFISSYNDGYTVPQEGIIYIAIGNTPDITVNVEGAAAVTRAEFAAHRDDTENPHHVTAAQVGFANKSALDTVTAAAISSWNAAAAASHGHNNKDVLDAITAAVKAGYDAAVTHTQSRANPHNVTAAQVGLGNVTNESKAAMFTAELGARNVIKAVPPAYIGKMPTKYCVFAVLWDEYNYDAGGNSNVYAFTTDLQTGKRYRAVQDSAFDFSIPHTWTEI